MRFFCLATLLFFAGALLPASSVAQEKEEKTVAGVVLDSLDKTPLENCTLTFANGQATKRLMTSEKGSFSFQSKTDTVTVLLQHVGYTDKRFTLFPKNPKGTDTLLLAPASAVMEDVVIKAKLPPVVVRGDTTEYNVDSSMFEPFDAVKDLLKRLPGLEIDAAGRMTFHGKSITRILVDGEDLFGGDPNFSLNKLPAGLVAKIQVMDTRTLEQLFNNTPSDGEEKTLNIKLKAGDKTFGSAEIAGGTKNNLDGNVDLSRFNNGKRISLTGSYNSINKTGLFTPDGGPATSNAGAGLNYGNKLGDLRFNGSYNFSQNSSSNQSYRERTQQITTDTSFFTKASNRFNNAYAGHRASLNASLWIDSSSTLDATLSFGATSSTNKSAASSQTHENGLLRNESANNTTSAGESQNYAAALTWRKSLNRKGRSLFVTAAATGSHQLTDLFSQSVNTYFKAGAVAGGDTLDRQTVNNNSTRSYAASFTYSEPVTKTLYFNLSGNANWSSSNGLRSIYNLDSLTHKPTFDSAYSAEVATTDATQYLGASLSYRGKKLNLTTGLTTTRQQTVRLLQGQTIRQHLLRHSPTLSAWYTLNKGKALWAAFSATTIQPTVDQLQPVPDNSNPLYIRLGNPALRTAFSQNYTLRYNYNGSKGNLSAGASYAPISNQIVNAVTYDAFRRVTAQAVNVSGVYTGRANVNYDRYYHQEKLLTTLNLSSAAQMGQQVYFQSNRQYRSRNYSVNGRAGFNRQKQGIREAGFGFSLSPSFSRTWTPGDPAVLNTTRLGLAPEIEGSCRLFGFVYQTLSYKVWYNKLDYHSPLHANAEYSLHQLNHHLRFGLTKGWSAQTTLSYQYNTQVPDGVTKGQVNNSLSVDGLVWKGRGRINLTASDLFAAKSTLQRVVGDNFIEDVQIANLRNYFTVRLQWGFSSLEREEKKARSSTK